MSRFLQERLQTFSAYKPGEQPEKTQKLIKLNTNENPYPPAPSVVSGLTHSDIEDLRLYSDLAAGELVFALAQDVGMNEENILVGNGSDELIYFAMLAFGGAGVRFADITYGFYRVWANLIGIECDIVPLEQDFTIDPSKYMGNDKMVIIANPNAPTGIALPVAAIEAIVCANPDQVVLVDEAYVDFGAESCAHLVYKYDNLMIMRTFSKSRQMAGVRLGFSIAHQDLTDDLNKMRYAINPYNVNSLTQRLGWLSLGDAAYFEEAIAKIKRTREYTQTALTKQGFCVLPSSANFVFAGHPDLSGQAYMQALREQDILVRWFDQDRIRGFVRISIGTLAQMEILVDATRQILQERSERI